MDSPIILPVCITIDVSMSMSANGAIEALNACLPDLKSMMQDEPLVAELARVGIVTFNDSADQLVPMTDLSDVEMPAVEATGGTSYTAALKATRNFLEQSVRGFGSNAQYYKPIVFFLTDGQPLDPEASWRPEADALRSGKYGANVVCFGFNQASAEVLSKVGRTFIFKETNPVAAVQEIFMTLIGSISRTSQSISSTSKPGMVLPAELLENADLTMEMEVQRV